VPGLALDASRSTVRIRTFAEGLFAKLAHDLELSCGKLSGTGSRDDDTLAGTATVQVPLDGFAVAGVLHKDGRVDEHGLSPSDSKDCLAKMCEDVFHASASAKVRVEAKAEGGAVRAKVIPPAGKTVEIVTRPAVSAEGGGVRAKGSFELSLSALGSDVVKGPMGAFRVKDRVEVTFDLVFAPEAAPEG